MNTPEFIEMKLKNAKLNVQNVTIIFIANVQGISTNIADYSDSSVLTEFLSMEEYNELLNACQDFGFYTLTYFEVNEFVKDYLCGKFKNTKLILFEGTQKGTGRGKDAFIPSFCDLSLIIHTGPNAYVNSLCTNKYHWSKLLEVHKIVVPKSWRYDEGRWLNNEIPNTSQKLIAKPCYECASIGIHKESVGYYSNDYEKYLLKISHAYQQPLIVQEFISGYEVEVPVFISEAVPYVLPPVVLYKDQTYSMADSFLDFDDIYGDNYHFCLLDEINMEWSANIQKIACKIVEILELERYARIDFRIDNAGTAYVTDVNSYPHIVYHSSFAFAFEKLDFNRQHLLPSIIGNVLPIQP